VIRGTGDERLVNFQQDDITFRGFEVRGDNVITPKAECVDIKEAASFNTVEDNQCSGSRDPDGAGFSSRGEHNAFIGNVSTGNRGDGIRLGGDGKTQGLHNDVIGNTLSDNRGFGLDVERSPRERCAEIRQPATARGSSTGRRSDRSLLSAVGVLTRP
jgi:hypothetical protein